jgi:predicted dehydrogenase
MSGISLRVVLVGAGHWHAARHLDSLLSLGHRIVGVTDPDAAKARRAADQLGCPWATEPTDLLSRLKPDLIMAMGVHRQVPGILESLLDAGLPLLLEKPLGRNAGEARPLVEKAERAGLFVAICFPLRYAEIWARMRELQVAGCLGEISYVSFRLINGTPDRYRADDVRWMLDPGAAGGGSLINLGIHCCDAFLRSAGGPARVLAAEISNKIHRLPVEDYSLAALRSSAGVLGLIETGYSYPADAGGDMEWRVVSERAYLQQGREHLAVRTLGGVPEIKAVPSFLELYRRMTQDIIERLRRGDPPPASMRHCLEAMEMIDAIYAAAGDLPFTPRPLEDSR